MGWWTLCQCDNSDNLQILSAHDLSIEINIWFWPPGSVWVLPVLRCCFMLFQRFRLTPHLALILRWSEVGPCCGRLGNTNRWCGANQHQVTTPCWAKGGAGCKWKTGRCSHHVLEIYNHLLSINDYKWVKWLHACTWLFMPKRRRGKNIIVWRYHLEPGSWNHSTTECARAHDRKLLSGGDGMISEVSSPFLAWYRPLFFLSRNSWCHP